MAEGLYVVLPSGYEYDFVSTVYEEYHCLICHLPVREPVLTRCGHRYCKNCLEEAMRRQRIPECPVDREVLDKEKDVFPDKATERKILSCHVKCPSVSCEWTGETRDAEKHLQGCCHKVIQCPNLHCHVTVERRLLDDHVANTCQWRAVQCTFCGERHPECEGQKHAAECRRLLIDCTNGCGDVIAREEMRTHQEQVCPLTVVNCAYEYLGCDSKIKRRDVADHLEQSLRSHFELSIGRLNHVQDEHKKQQRELEQVKLDYHSVVSRLAGLEKDVTELKSRQKDMETFSPFIWKLPDFWERVRRAKSDRDIRVESEPFYVGYQGYKMKLAMYPNGTKEAKNAYISFYVAVMKGKYDAILPWPFRYRVILTIIDQNPDPMQRNNFVKSFLPEPTWTSMQRPTSDENERRGFGRFFSHEKLRTGSYIVDDALFIKFEVSPQENLELHVTRNDLSRREVKY